MVEDRFFDIYTSSLNKQGEELCGDKVKFSKGDRAIAIVLSDGLGSGVKANILSSLTTEILIAMLSANVPLEEIISTVIGTLPICQVRKIAYSTFTIIQINPETGEFKVINFDNPPVFYYQKGRLIKLKTETERVLGKKIQFSEGILEQGDFLGAVSDGVLYAGLGTTMNFGWGWDNVAQFIEKLFLAEARKARNIVQKTIAQTHQLYGGAMGDDTTFVGVYVRQRNPLTIFTGPPLDKSKDVDYVQRLLDATGRKAICGGTTGNIVARHLGKTVEMDIATMRRDLPPIGKLQGVDLITEGILTISKAIELLRKSQCDESRLPSDPNGAVLLAREILEADSVFFLVGQQINEFYQNPLLPKNISIRRNLIEELVDLLRQHQREVQIEYC